MARRQSAAANRAALAGLKHAAGSLRGAPGFTETGARLHGRYATALVDGVTLHLFEYEITFEMELFDATAHGERWKVFVQGDQQWTLRARGYFTRGTAAYLARAASTSADPLATTVQAFQEDETASPANDTDRLWVGAGFITRCNFSVPMGMVMQEIEIRGTGAPTKINIG